MLLINQFKIIVLNLNCWLTNECKLTKGIQPRIQLEKKCKVKSLENKVIEFELSRCTYLQIGYSSGFGTNKCGDLAVNWTKKNKMLNV